LEVGGGSKRKGEEDDAEADKAVSQTVQMEEGHNGAGCLFRLRDADTLTGIWGFLYHVTITWDKGGRLLRQWLQQAD